MADNADNKDNKDQASEQATGGTNEPAMKFIIQRIYIKDSSMQYFPDT